jgi:ribosome-binding ATPase YchF (GTP1/OBG family)
MSDDSPTEHIHEDILERARESRDAWINWAAATAAALAALAAISGAMSNNYLTVSGRDQIQSNDEWSQYQAKSIKASVLRGKMEVLAALNKPESAADQQKLHEYEHDLGTINENAEHLHESSESHLTRHETIERGVTLFHIGIAVVAIAVLTRRRAFWYLSLLSGAVGIVFFALAFVR